MDGDTEMDWKPRIGMVFPNYERAYDFYNAYGRAVGFGIRKSSANRHRTLGHVTSAKIVCCKEGKRLKDKRDCMVIKHRAETRTECCACLHLSYDRVEEHLFVDDFFEEHNHELVKADFIKFLRSQRNIGKAQVCEIELAEDCGIRVGPSFDLMAKEAGTTATLGFTRLDVKNLLRTRRQKQQQFGEVVCILTYFKSQLLHNPFLFYDMQLDCDNLMANIFWADARMIIDYSLFGDVVTFDTTYKMNNAHRPLAVFVGLNHHRESVIFGAALMYDETIESFVWLFESFLATMSMKAPKTILTDQDAAMSKALEIVMPETEHCLCIWHIMQNALKHLGHVICADVGIRSVLFQFMKCVDAKELFLSHWKDMLDDFDVTKNKWLSDLFALKRKWAKCYVKHHWCAGMRTTELGESFNCQVKRFLRSDHCIPDFFKQFERLVSQLRLNEKHSEFDLCNKLSMITFHSPMIQQAGKLFTRQIFERFQKHFLRSVNAYIGENIIDESAELKYTVIVVEGHRSERCVRRIKTTNQLICDCGKFEMEGVPCCHVINILREVLHETQIPMEYICKRWTRNARDETIHDIVGNVVEADANHQESIRYKKLCHLATRLNVAAAATEKYYLLVLKNFESMLNSVDKRDNTPNHPTTNDGNHVDEQNISAIVLKKKDAWRGQRKKCRNKPGYEVAAAKKKKAYAKEGRMNSNAAEGRKKKPVSNETSSTPTSSFCWSFTQPMSTTGSAQPSSHATNNPLSQLEDITTQSARKIMFPLPDLNEVTNEDPCKLT